MNNYRSLIIAGYGTIGGSLVALAPDTIASFRHVWVIDADCDQAARTRENAFEFVAGDVNRPQFLRDMFHRVELPAVFLNAGINIDNLALRQLIATYDMAYIDTAAGLREGCIELFMEKLMPYSYTTVESPRPHLLHFGVNPGMVEIIARKLMREAPDTAYDVMIYEYDDLRVPLNGKYAVGWSPQSLVEETVLCPSFELIDGRPVEAAAGPTRKITVSWQGEEVISRIVGHEEIWNFGQYGPVVNARFAYGLHRDVMHILDGDPRTVLSRLEVPNGSAPLHGADRIAVVVRPHSRGTAHTLFWEVDHHEVWQRCGINAVQYQTGTSVILALELLQHTAYGLLEGAYTASTLPIDDAQWNMLESLMQTLGCSWQDGTHLNLHVREQ